MTEAEKGLFMLASRLLEYPDSELFEALPELQADLHAAEAENASPTGLAALVDWLAQTGLMGAQEHYVRVFDHDPGASLYLSWHRYGNDRGQGKAMAALNGLYRAAGLEPEPGVLPDYLPRVLEFTGASEDWAIEALLDGFGPEMDAMERHLAEIESPYAALFKAFLDPLRAAWPEKLKPRTDPDRTLRPLARPEGEAPLFDNMPGCRIPE